MQRAASTYACCGPRVRIYTIPDSQTWKHGNLTEYDYSFTVLFRLSYAFSDLGLERSSLFPLINKQTWQFKNRTLHPCSMFVSYDTLPADINSSEKRSHQMHWCCMFIRSTNTYAEISCHNRSLTVLNSPQLYITFPLEWQHNFHTQKTVLKTFYINEWESTLTWSMTPSTVCRPTPPKVQE